MKKKSNKPTLWIVSLILFASVTSMWLQLEIPAPGGPYAVSRMIFNWVDTSRPEVLTDDPDDFREVIAVFWYPAIRGTGTNAGYFPDLSILSSALTESGEIEAWQVLSLRLVRSESNLDAEPVRDLGAFPVVILSPGNGTNVEFYTSLAEEIASYGYIVVGLNHPYDVAAVELSDGSIAPYDKDQWSLGMREHQILTAGRIEVRTADMLFALDQLTFMNAYSKGLFAGLLDLDSLAAVGHSLGGITASEACKADSRIKSCLNWDGLQAGSPFSTDFEAAAPSQPFLFLTKESQLHPRQIENFESSVESYWVVIRNASHDSFTDGPSLAPSLLPLPGQADRLMDLIQKYTLAFLNRTLKGQFDALPDKSTVQGGVLVHIFPSR